MMAALKSFLELGVRDVIVLDTEYIARDVGSQILKNKKKDKKIPDGNPVTPACLCAKSLITGQEWRVLAAAGARNPLPMEPEVLYVCFSAPAEWSYFLAMGWELPPTIIDLYAERMMQTCGDKETEGKRRGKRYRPTLLRSMATYGLDAISAAEKESMRDLIKRGGPYTQEEQTAIFEYCMGDATDAGELFEAMLPKLHIPYALMRGNFTRVVAWWQFNGIPVDVPAYRRLIRYLGQLKGRLIAAVEQENGYGVYVRKPDGTEKWDRKGFTALVHRLDLQDVWPRTASGRDFAIADGDERPDEERVFKQMTQLCPYLEPLRQVRKFVTTLRNFELFIGDDGRSRVYPNPWWTNTGRANPSNSNFIFTLPKWARMHVKPGPRQALSYIDLKSAEIGIAAGLSRDPNMMKIYVDSLKPGGVDCYVGFAKLAGAIPPEGTKETHPKERKLYKVAMLAAQYGQSWESLARQNGLEPWIARKLHDDHKRIYAKYWDWIDAEVLHAEAAAHMETLFGWRRPVSGENAKRNALLNFPIQAGCAEILRLATAYMLDAGVAICACVHDAVLVEAPIGEIEAVVATCKECFRRASAEYLDGFELGSDAKIIRFPARWGDNGEEDSGDIGLWGRVQRLLDEIESEETCRRDGLDHGVNGSALVEVGRATPVSVGEIGAG